MKNASVATGPVVRDRNVDVGMGLNAAGQDDHSRGVDGIASADVVERTGSGHGGDLLALDSDVSQGSALRSNYGSALDDQVQHNCLR